MPWIFCRGFRHQFKLQIEEITASKKAGAEAQAEHQKKLLDRLKANDFLILLDERRLYSTSELADQITQWELSPFFGLCYRRRRWMV